MMLRDVMPALLCTIITAKGAGASIQNPLNQNLTSATTAPVQGEIEYTFDTIRNKGTAQYRTSLASGNLWKRLLTSSPTVHTLVVAYEFADPKDEHPPSAIQLTLVSDEYTIASDVEAIGIEVAPLLEIDLPDSALRYPADVSQQTEIRSTPPPQLYRAFNQNDRGPRVQVNTGMLDVHIHRSATVRLSLGDFLALTTARELRGTVAGLDFHFSEQVLAGLRQFGSEMHRRPIVYSPQRLVWRQHFRQSLEN